jgi:glycerophosphoryl diester phosphodiesterase
VQGDGEGRRPDRTRLGAHGERRPPSSALDEIAQRGASSAGSAAAFVAGPPWILGLRGSPLEAPENTLASFRRALDLGLDGIACDVRACATGEAVLMRDPAIDRTTDGTGLLAEKTLVDLAPLDAGGWFRARFRGERVALLEEALELESIPEPAHGRRPRHVVWLREPGLVREVARVLQGFERDAVIVASASREVCLEIRDAGLAPMLVIPTASEEARAFVRDERIRACAIGSGSFPTASGATEGNGAADWPTERWTMGADSPAELLAACRAPYAGVVTREPLRALALRALCALVPDFRGPHPLVVPELEMHPEDATADRRATGADWKGSWKCVAEVANPFPFAVEATAGVIPRHGAFETEGLPKKLALGPGSAARVEFGLAGGSWRVGGDPLFFALYRWRRAKGRRAATLLLDAPLARVRTATADVLAQRLALVRESPRDAPASLVLRRRGRDVFVAIENAGGLENPRTIVFLDGRHLRGGRGVRVRLPDDFDVRTEGVPFSCGIEAISRVKGSAESARPAGGERIVRRWAGGIPEEDDAGSPGRLRPHASA